MSRNPAPGLRPHPWVALPLLASLSLDCGGVVDPSERVGDAPTDGAPAAVPPGATTPAQAHGVVLVVWEGLRSDALDPRRTPNAAAIAREGVSFSSHHAAFPSRAMVNASVLATGRSPGSTTLLGDLVPSPTYALLSARDPSVAKTLDARGDSLFAAARRAGLRTTTLGTDGAAAIFDDGGDPDSNAAPAASPVDADRRVVRDWSRRVLEGPRPRLSVLWLGATARAEETYGPGSPAALAALAADDALVGAIRARVDEADGDLFVVSSNGASSVAPASTSRTAADDMRAAGADVVVAPNGSTDLVYVPGHDSAVVTRVVAAAQRRGDVGAIFVAKWYAPVAGALVLAEVFADAGDAGPDVVVTYAFDPDALGAGDFGASFADSANLRGTTGGGARAELVVPMLAVGAHLRHGFVDPLPSGNVDVAPTIARILGLTLTACDGRVLDEALLGGSTDVYRTYGAVETSPPAAPRDAVDAAGHHEPRPRVSTQIELRAIDRGPRTFQYLETTRAVHE
jgi:hypothetical protein